MCRTAVSSIWIPSLPRWRAARRPSRSRPRVPRLNPNPRPRLRLRLSRSRSPHPGQVCSAAGRTASRRRPRDEAAEPQAARRTRAQDAPRAPGRGAAGSRSGCVCGRTGGGRRIRSTRGAHRRARSQGGRAPRKSRRQSGGGARRAARPSSQQSRERRKRTTRTICRPCRTRCRHRRCPRRSLRRT